MKENIKLLAEQAGLGQERWNTTEQFNSFLEKFSELIVRECVNTLDQQYVTISDDADPEDNKTWIGAIMNTTVARCKHSILSNFGVIE
jgi:hypothetical protein